MVRLVFFFKLAVSIDKADRSKRFLSALSDQ